MQRLLNNYETVTLKRMALGLFCFALGVILVLPTQAKTKIYPSSAVVGQAKQSYALPALPTHPQGSAQNSFNATRLADLQPSNMPQLPAMEQTWLGTPANPNLTVTQRLGLLEAFIFGAPKADSLAPDQRYNALLQVYTQTRPPAQTADADLDPVEATTATAVKPVVKSVATNKTPMVTQSAIKQTLPKPALLATLEGMEQRVMGQTSPQFSIEERLDQLETSLYGAPLIGPVQERLAALEKRLGGSGGGQTQNGSSASQVTNNTLPPPFTGNAGGAPPVVYDPSPNVNAAGANPNAAAGNGSTLIGQLNSLDRQKLESLEQQVFKQTFPSKADAERLGRLEMSVFNQSAPASASPEERLTRLEAVIAASPSRGVHDVNRNNALQLLIPFALGALMILL